MDYHRGLLRQRGHGFLGPLLKLGLPLVGSAVAPLLGDLAGGLVKKIKHRQKGSGFVTNALKTAAKHGILVTGNAAIDSLNNKGTFMQGLRRHGTQTLRNVGVHAVEQQLRRNLPILRAPIVGSVLNKTLMPVVRRKVGTAIDNTVNKILGQRGKGFATELIRTGAKHLPHLMKHGTKALMKKGVQQAPRFLRKGAHDLVKTGTQQALQSAAQAGFDVLNQKGSLKKVVKSRGLQAVHRTGRTMKKKYLPPKQGIVLARGGPHKRKRKRTKTPAAKKSRTADIFD